jgi:phosphoribosylformylglycinamidine synthase
LTRDDATTQGLWEQGLVTLSYVDAQGNPANYPDNPNGSVSGIAALCNPAGNVMGLMPHPEDHIFTWQHPRWHRGESGCLGLSLIQNGIKHA